MAKQRNYRPVNQNAVDFFNNHNQGTRVSKRIPNRNINLKVGDHQPTVQGRHYIMKYV